MSKVTDGLKKLAKRDNLPSGEYRFRIDRVGTTRNGDGEGAFLVAIEAPDPELKGKKAYLYLRNFTTELSIGLSQLMASLQLLEVPSGEHGENDTHNFAGLEFDADIIVKPDKSGNDRSQVTPAYDADWLEEVRNCSEEEMDERIAKERAGTGRSKKKAPKKRASKR